MTYVETCVCVCVCVCAFVCVCAVCDDVLKRIVLLASRLVDAMMKKYAVMMVDRETNLWYVYWLKPASCA